MYLLPFSTITSLPIDLSFTLPDEAIVHIPQQGYTA